MQAWLKECEICNTGLCKTMAQLTDSVEKSGLGLSVREAAKQLEGLAEKEIGSKVWSAEQIRARYLYHTGQMVSGRKPTTPKKMIAPHPTTKLCPPPVPVVLEEVIDCKFASTEAPSPAGPCGPLWKSNKEEFLKLIKNMHRVWCEANGLEQNLERVPIHLIISTTKPHDKNSTRYSDVSITLYQYKKMMNGIADPIEFEIYVAASRFLSDLSLNSSLTVPVPHQVYDKARGKCLLKKTRRK